MSATWQAHDALLMRGWYSFLRVTKDNDGNVPRNTAFLMSSLDITDDVELDLISRYVDELPGSGVDSYFNLDVRLGYSPIDDLYLSVVGQNLLDTTHEEFNESTAFARSSQIRRGVFAQVEWRY